MKVFFLVTLKSVESFDILEKALLEKRFVPGLKGVDICRTITPSNTANVQ